MSTSTIYAALLALSTTALILLPILLHRLRTILSPRRPKPQIRSDGAHILIVLGSGGHTAEMMGMLARAGIEWARFRRRTWVVGSGDAISAERARAFEESVVGGGGGGADDGRYAVEVVPRAREIHQSAYTAPVSCLQCAWRCVSILADREHDFPDVILCNGPATATVLVLTGVVLRFFDFGGCHSRGKMRTVYVESWARVKRCSLSGRLLGWVVERFCVQWRQLEGCAGGKGEFVGVLV